MQRQDHSHSQDKVLEQAKDLIQREIKFCRTLRAMISRELEAIVLNGNMDELADILEQKDGVISQLQLLADGWRDVLEDSGLQGSISGTEGFGMRLLELYPDDTELPALIEESREIAQYRSLRNIPPGSGLRWYHAHRQRMPPQAMQKWEGGISNKL